MKVYVSIIAETGEITGFYTLSNIADVQANAASDEIIIEADTADFDDDLNSDLFWYDAGTFDVRPCLLMPSYTIAADDTDSVSAQLPIGTVVRFANQDHPVAEAADRAFEFTSAVPGRFEVKVMPPFPYQTQNVEIVVE